MTHSKMPSARYTYASADSMSKLLDDVNDFCKKYPEYHLLQVVEGRAFFYAILTTDGTL